jgi:alpha-1,6-mannosyltransferase
LPLFFKKLRFKKWVAFCAVVVGITVLLFAPFISTEFLINYADTVALWFRKFEFNASIYYVLRAIGYTFRGYNEIAIIGKIISIAVILFVLVFAMLKKNMSTIGLIYSMLFVIAFYFFTTTTMHPWYLATPLLLSLFTKYRFTLVWSFVIFLSYFAYVNNTHQENYWLLIVEYSVVYAVFFYEIYTQKKDTKKPAITD